mmetsp:Transcript_23463/g.35683  ORF Transcript_23463/g.35683 Transcript_23463/m.35683 type:complete len:190 (+) Transcript_23463:87-656(+)|eukprot:CAMPEP_0196143344 /NCGR_PEP_ID=MMETSP0910-20130528/13153_1 /TAXON_ID=49265 /ORGANISM="Thalassiosira rotula, Strain GSO102" /LENGTH=189 /DNA_ID=CAMNT_0041404787 /DNA_START=90 /DNA_END=659 /DNA_ORIENTATION=+
MDSSKSVTFSETSEMVLINDLSRGPDKHNIWFTPDELDSFQDSSSRHAKILRRQISKRRKDEQPSASDILGLEKYLTIQLTREYLHRRNNLAKQVVGEARRQRQQQQTSPHDEDDDVDRLARISARNSKWARQRARAAALFLEQDQETERATVTEGPGQEEYQLNDMRWSNQTSLDETIRSRRTVPSFA